MFSPGPSYHQEETSPNQGTDRKSPERKTMISLTSYAEMQEIIENFLKSKRFARDAENNYNFLKAGPRSNCARVDAVYSLRAGAKSHIKVQDKDQYWAEEERKFPHLKEVHQLEEDLMSTQPAGSSSSKTKDPADPGTPVNPPAVANTIRVRSEEAHLRPTRDVKLMKQTRDPHNPAVPARQLTVSHNPQQLPASSIPKQSPVTGNPRQMPVPSTSGQSPVVTYTRQFAAPGNPRQMPVPSTSRQSPVATKVRQFAVPVNPKQMPVPSTSRQSPVATNVRQSAVPGKPRKLPTSANPRQSPVPTNPRQSKVRVKGRQFAVPPPPKKPKLHKMYKMLLPQQPTQR